jgi:dihydroorotate dehydrogenase electron transfer subunit
MINKVFIGEILKNDEIQNNYFLMKVALHNTFTEPQPGQFVMLRIAGLSEPFLGRPISIYSFSQGKNFCSMELLYRVVGRGTEIMAGLLKNSQVEIHGPLGSSFSIYPEKENIVFIAGGIGFAPLSLLANNLCKNFCYEKSRLTFYLGAQTKTEIIGLERLKELCYHVHVCTDDGTVGKKMLVTQAFEKDMKIYQPEHTAVYACGPKGMLKVLAKMMNDKKYNCQVSLEEKMACGTGACMGCATAIKENNKSIAYKRVCTDGPVFNLKDVICE